MICQSIFNHIYTQYSHNIQTYVCVYNIYIYIYVWDFLLRDVFPACAYCCCSLLIRQESQQLLSWNFSGYPVAKTRAGKLQMVPDGSATAKSEEWPMEQFRQVGQLWSGKNYWKIHGKITSMEWHRLGHINKYTYLGQIITTSLRPHWKHG